MFGLLLCVIFNVRNQGFPIKFQFIVYKNFFYRLTIILDKFYSYLCFRHTQEALARFAAKMEKKLRPEEGTIELIPNDPLTR